jgi:uncharacterized protein YjbI with pentapeptide repeats
MEAASTRLAVAAAAHAFVQSSLEWANLSDANLLMANLAEASLEGATYGEATVWPDGFDADAAVSPRE